MANVSHDSPVLIDRPLPDCGHRSRHPHAAASPSHSVAFYDGGTALPEAVFLFVEEALRRDKTVLLIATPQHAKCLDEHLQRAGLELETLRSGSRYLVLDAATTLASISSDGHPDPIKFNDIVGSRVSQILAAGHQLDAFGEMVDLLCAANKIEEALLLETMWNDLQKAYPFALLCAYNLRRFPNIESRDQFRHVCDLHSRVLPSDSFSQNPKSDDELRLIARLEQRSLALEAEIARREKLQQHLQAVIDHTPECIKLVAPDGTLLSMNDAGYQMLAVREPSALLGKCIYDVIAPEDRQSFIAFNKQVCAGRAGTLSFQLLDAHGERHFMETNAVPLPDSESGHFNQLAITRDVTTRVKADQRSRFLAAVVESSDDAIITKDLDGIITSWNKGAERLFGYVADEVLGKPITLLIPPDRLDEEPQILARLRRGERLDHFETVRRRKDGSDLHISLTISPVRDSAGRIVGASKIARDISEIRRAREAMERTNEELERRVAERTASLTEALTQMQEFSYSISHDLRAPARAMRCFAQAALEDHSTTLHPEVREHLERVIAGAQRMDQLVKDMLEYAKVAGREVRLAPVSLEMLIPRVLQSDPQMQPPRSRISLRGPLGNVLAHESSLAQAVTNLILNAVKFVPRGTTPQIELWSERNNGSVRLFVRDNGIGVNPKHRAKLFRIFERVHEQPGYEGTGIGLAIVRKAVEKMGGRVGVESDGRTGSTFWVELQAAGAEQELHQKALAL